MNNPRLQTIKVSIESSESVGDLPQMVARNVNKFESETKYPFLDTDYISEAY
jgi:hypothetical protein